jgi:lysyl-tRNA synthetase class 2
MELNDLQQQRAAKLERLRAAGIEAYPPRAQRSHTIAAVLADFDALAERGECVTAVGRIVGARRVMGKLAFAHIEDESGRIQLWLSKGDMGAEWFEHFRDDIDTFDVLQATGTLRRTKTGEPSLFVENLALLAKSINPPPEKWEGLQDVHAPQPAQAGPLPAYRGGAVPQAPDRRRLRARVRDQQGVPQRGRGPHP